MALRQLVYGTVEVAAICTVGSGVLTLSWGYPVDQWGSGELSSQSSWQILCLANQLVVLLALKTVAASCWKKKIAVSMKLVSRLKHECSKMSCRQLCLLWTSHCVSSTLDCVSTLGPTFSNEMRKITLMWKEDFGPSGRSRKFYRGRERAKE